MAFLELYIDESYGSLSPNIVVSGFASQIDRWSEFASIWKEEILSGFASPSCT